jgi:hypothetical protein
MAATENQADNLNRVHSTGGALASAGILVAYSALATAAALTKLPLSNEAWFANPALTLITGHYMGTPILETSGTWLQGLDRYTYWIMPLHILAQAAWYKVFGFSLFTLRLLSVAWGVVALAAWWLILAELTRSQRVALLGCALIATDFTFVTNAATGRMDMMCAALGFAGLAAYLALRECNLVGAMLAGNALVAASGLTHPCGIMPFVGLWFLVFYFDRARLKGWLVAVAAVPYLAGAVAWGAYILQSPSLFWAQFVGNISGFAGEYSSSSRFLGLHSPWKALKDEIFNRYLQNFGLTVRWTEAGRLKLLIPLAFVVGILILVGRADLRLQKGHRALLLLAAIYFLILTFFEGMKLPSYLVHTVPLFAAMLAVAFHSCFTHPFRYAPRWLVGLGVALLVALQVSVLASQVHRNVYRRHYLPTVAFLENRADAHSLIIGPAAFAFQFGFEGRIVDDVRLGCRSGKTPDFIVVGAWYQKWFKTAATRDPVLHQCIEGRLTQEYIEVFRNDEYTVYSRREARAREGEQGHSSGR